VDDDYHEAGSRPRKRPEGLAAALAVSPRVEAGMIFFMSPAKEILASRISTIQLSSNGYPYFFQGIGFFDVLTGAKA